MDVLLHASNNSTTQRPGGVANFSSRIDALRNSRNSTIIAAAPSSNVPFDTKGTAGNSALDLEPVPSVADLGPRRTSLQNLSGARRGTSGSVTLPTALDILHLPLNSTTIHNGAEAPSNFSNLTSNTINGRSAPGGSSGRRDNTTLSSNNSVLDHPNNHHNNHARSHHPPISFHTIGTTVQAVLSTAHHNAPTSTLSPTSRSHRRQLLVAANGDPSIGGKTGLVLEVSREEEEGQRIPDTSMPTTVVGEEEAHPTVWNTPSGTMVMLGTRGSIGVAHRDGVHTSPTQLAHTQFLPSTAEQGMVTSSHGMQGAPHSTMVADSCVRGAGVLQPQQQQPPQHRTTAHSVSPFQMVLQNRNNDWDSELDNEEDEEDAQGEHLRIAALGLLAPLPPDRVERTVTEQPESPEGGHNERRESFSSNSTAEVLTETARSKTDTAPPLPAATSGLLGAGSASCTCTAADAATQHLERVFLQFATLLSAASLKKKQALERSHNAASLIAGSLEHLGLCRDAALRAMHSLGLQLTFEDMESLLRELDEKLIEADLSPYRSTQQYQHPHVTQPSPPPPPPPPHASRMDTPSMQQHNELSVSTGEGGALHPPSAPSALIRWVAASSSSGRALKDEQEEQSHVTSSSSRVGRANDISFDMFRKLITLWQLSENFQRLERRSHNAQQHIDRVTKLPFLLPDSRGMFLWHVLVLAAATYVALVGIAVFGFEEATLFPILATLTAFDVISSIVFGIDMILQFVTVRIQEAHLGKPMKVISQLPEIARAYVGSWGFWVDLISLIPWRFGLLFGGEPDYEFDRRIFVHSGSGASSSPSGFVWTSRHQTASGCFRCTTADDAVLAAQIVRFLMLVRVLKYLTHVRLFEESALQLLTKWYVRRHYVIAPLLLIASRFLVVVNFLAVMYMLFDAVPYMSKRPMKGSGETVLENDSTAPSYAAAVYLVMYCMSTAGLGDQIPVNDGQRMYLMLLCVCGTFFNALVVGTFVSFFRHSDIDSQRQNQLIELSTVLEYFEFPGSLTEEIISFENYILQYSLTKAYKRVVEGLPQDMQRNLDLCTRIRAVNIVPVFRDAHYSAKMQICNLMVPVTVCPEEVLFMIGETPNEMMFINHGFIDLLDEANVLIETKKAGSFFGEDGTLYTSTKRFYDAKALTYCDLFFVWKSELLALLDVIPRLKCMIARLGEEYFRSLHGASLAARIQNRMNLIPSVVDRQPQNALHITAGRQGEIRDSMHVSEGTASASNGEPVPLSQPSGQDEPTLATAGLDEAATPSAVGRTISGGDIVRTLSVAERLNAVHQQQHHHRHQHHHHSQTTGTLFLQQQQQLQRRGSTPLPLDNPFLNPNILGSASHDVSPVTVPLPLSATDVVARGNHHERGLRSSSSLAPQQSTSVSRVPFVPKRRLSILEPMTIDGSTSCRGAADVVNDDRDSSALHRFLVPPQSAPAASRWVGWTHSVEVKHLTNNSESVREGCGGQANSNTPLAAASGNNSPGGVGEEEPSDTFYFPFPTAAEAGGGAGGPPPQPTHHQVMSFSVPASSSSSISRMDATAARFEQLLLHAMEGKPLPNTASASAALPPVVPSQRRGSSASAYPYVGGSFLGGGGGGSVGAPRSPNRDSLVPAAAAAVNLPTTSTTAAVGGGAGRTLSVRNPLLPLSFQGSSTEHSSAGRASSSVAEVPLSAGRANVLSNSQPPQHHLPHGAWSSATPAPMSTAYRRATESQQQQQLTSNLDFSIRGTSLSALLAANPFQQGNDGTAAGHSPLPTANVAPVIGLNLRTATRVAGGGLGSVAQSLALTTSGVYETEAPPLRGVLDAELEDYLRQTADADDYLLLIDVLLECLQQL